MTDPSVDPDQARLERIARLGRTPSSTRSPQRRRRRHPAQRSRIVAASLGATTMFGIVTALGVSNAAATPAVDPVAPDAVSALAAITPDPTVAPAPTTAATVPATIPSTLPAVTELAPAPAIKVLTPAPQPAATNPPRLAPRPAPVATTSGS